MNIKTISFLLLSLVSSSFFNKYLILKGYKVTSQESILIFLGFSFLSFFIIEIYFFLFRNISSNFKIYIKLAPMLWLGIIISYFYEGVELSYIVFLPFIMLIYGLILPLNYSRKYFFSNIEFYFSIYSQLIAVSLLFKIFNKYEYNLLSFIFLQIIILFFGEFKIFKFLISERFVSFSNVLLIIFLCNYFQDQLYYNFTNISLVCNIIKIVFILIITHVHFIDNNHKNRTPIFYLNRIVLICFFIGLFFEFHYFYLLEMKFIEFDWHFWYHTTHGLTSIFQGSSPFITFFPVEGAFWEYYLPNIVFEIFNLRFVDYYLILTILGVISKLFYILIITYVVENYFHLKKYFGLLLGFIIIITNEYLLNLYQVHLFAWTILERSWWVLFSTYMLLLYTKKIYEEKNYTSFVIYSFALGFCFGISFIFEFSLGVAAIFGFLFWGVIIKIPIKEKLMLAFGFLLAPIVYMIIFKIDPFFMFIQGPISVFNYGKTLIHPYNTNIVEILFKSDGFFYVFHHMSFLFSMVVFLYIVLNYKKFYFKNKFRVEVFFYFIVFSFIIYFSRGQKYLYQLYPTLSNIHHTIFSLIFLIPILLIVFSFLKIKNIKSKSFIIVLILIIASQYGTLKDASLTVDYERFEKLGILKDYKLRKFKKDIVHVLKRIYEKRDLNTIKSYYVRDEHFKEYQQIKGDIPNTW